MAYISASSKTKDVFTQCAPSTQISINLCHLLHVSWHLVTEYNRFYNRRRDPCPKNAGNADCNPWIRTHYSIELLHPFSYSLQHPFWSCCERNLIVECTCALSIPCHVSKWSCMDSREWDIRMEGDTSFASAKYKKKRGCLVPPELCLHAIVVANAIGLVMGHVDSM